MADFAGELQRLSGTTLDAAGAANAWAGTTGLELLGALNAKVAQTFQSQVVIEDETLTAIQDETGVSLYSETSLLTENYGWGLNAVCNLLAQTSGLEAPAALASMTSGAGATLSDLLLESGDHLLLEDGTSVLLLEQG